MANQKQEREFTAYDTWTWADGRVTTELLRWRYSSVTREARCLGRVTPQPPSKAVRT